jgi:uncharacterized repeat protein (TIGR01451 family)
MNTKSVAWKFLPILLILSLLLLYAHTVWAAQTAFFNPTQTASATGFTALTNPTNAFGDDAANATGTFSSTTTLGQQYFGYGASIPAGAVPQGIEVRVDYSLSNTSGTNTLSVDLSTNGTTWTTAYQNVAEPTSQITYIAGSPTELWGRTWTAADLSNLRVRVRMARTGTTLTGNFNLDWVSVRLTYNQQPNPPTNSAPADGATITSANPTFTWAFSDPDSGDTQSQFQVQLRQNPGNYTPAFRDYTSPTGTTGNSFNSSTALWNLPDGNYCWHVRVTDNSGASNATSAYSTDTCFTVDTTGSIGDRVWLDSNGDGSQAGEAGINGVTLTLLRGVTVVGTATTSGDGNYLFSGLQGPQPVYVADNFGSASYSNNNGTRNWAGNWIESDNAGAAQSPSAGNVLITGGQLRLTGAQNNSISRTVNLAGSLTADLSFELSASTTLNSSDTYVVEVSTNGGASYTTLASFSGNQSGPRSYSLSPYMAANTAIRFRITSGTFSGSDYFQVDNVTIQFQDTSQSTYTVVVDAGNFSPGGPLNGLNATSAAASPFVVSLGAAQNVTDADFGYGAFAVIGDLIYQDSSRNGAFDSGEPGLPNITVWLYTDGNSNGRIDGADSIVKTSSTDANGLYAFRGVSSGSYTVLADVNDPQLPGGFRPTSPNPVAVANVTVGNTYNNADIGFNTPPEVTKPLYLRAPTLLSRNQPTGLTPTTVQILSSEQYHDHSITWQMPISQALAGPLTFVSGQPVQAVLRIQANPSTSALACGGQPPDVTLTLSVVGGATLATRFINDMSIGLNTRFIDLNIPAGTTIPANGRLQLKIDASGADCSINYPNGNWQQQEDADGYIIVYFDSLTDLSRLELPVVSYIKIDQDGTFDAAYPGGAATPIFIQGDTAYVRATASDPFGSFDISSMVLSVPGVVTNAAMTRVATTALTSTYERALPSLAGGSYSYTITATEGLEGQVTAVATGTFQAIFSNLGNSSKTVNRATAAPGDVLTYTIVLSNTGGLPATVSMTDTLPPNVTHLNGPATPAGASYNAGLNAVLFNGSVPANGQLAITYSVRINSVLDNGTIIANSATISDTFGRFDTSPPATTVIQAAPNLSQSTKSVANVTTAGPGSSAAPGNTLEYTIVLSNTGNMNAVIGAGSPVLDDIPANTTFNGGLFASAGQIEYNPGFNRVEWIGVVPAGGIVTLRYRVRLATPLDNGLVITNTAIINEGAGFPSPQTYQRTVTTTVTSAPNLSQSFKLVDKATAAPGDSLAYTIILRNTGNMNAPGVVMTDTLPVQLTWGGDAFMSATSGDVQFITATNTVVWQGDLNAGTTVQILFRATANSPLPSGAQIVNVANVSDGAGNFAPFTRQAITLIQSSPNLNTSTKTVNTATASPGDTLTYTVRLVNTGNAVADATVVDALPAQLQNPVIISVSGGQAQVGGSVITWTGQVTPAQPVTITFRATLLSILNNGTQVVNTAQINDGFNPTFSINPPAVTTINSSPNLNTSRKTVNRATASPGDALIYTITLTNTGNMVANAQVLDTLPANVIFNGGLSASPGAPLPTYSSINNRISWQGSVTPTTPVTISYQVQINTPLDNGTVILNDAQISDGVNPGSFDTTPPAQTIITSAPNLTTSSKAVDLTTASPGNLLHYTIRLVNTGNMVASGVTISDTIPTQVTLASGPFITGGGSGGFNLAQRRVFWSGSVAPGSDVIVEYYVTINSPLPNGAQIVNDAQIQGSFGTITTNAVTTTIQSDHQLSLTKSAPSAIGAGQVMTYTIEYNVIGNEPAPNLVITDAVPANTTFVTCAGGVSCSQAGGVATWNLGNLVPGNSGAVTLRVTVNTPLPDGTVINNTARIFDTDGASAQANASTVVTSGHGFSLTKRDTGFDPVQAGSQITYSIDWSVAGTSVAQGLVITDVVPANTTYVSCGGAGTNCSQAGGVVTWNFINNQSPGASGTVTMTVNVNSPLPNGTVLTNQARIFDANGGLPANASEQTTVNSSHTLSVFKSGPPTIGAGGQLVYTIVYTVSGNGPAQNVVIEDSTPLNTTFASASGAPTIESPPAGNPGLVRWRLGNLSPLATGVVTLTVNVLSPLPNGTTINNTVSIRDDNGGAAGQHSTATPVGSGHSFTLSKTALPNPVAPDNFIVYTIHWQLNGNESAQNAIITDTLPANTTFSNCSGCAQQGGVVQWTLGNPTPGASGDVTLQVRVNTPLPNGTVITNTARISDGNGGTPATASATTTVTSDHQLTLSKNAPSAATAGQTINYSLNWSVTGNEPAPGVVVTDTLPANTTYVAGSCTGGCSVNGNVITWNLGNLVPGNSGTVSLAVTVGNLLPNGTILVNQARISDNDNAAATANATTQVTSGHGFSLTKSDSADPVQAGGQLTYNINWAVVGTEAAQTMIITDAVPANTTYVAGSCAPAPCSLAGNVVTWNLGNHNPSDAGTVSMSVNVAASLPNNTLLTNQARISDGNGGLPTTASQQTTVNSGHTLNVVKNAPATVAPGGQIAYTINWSVSGNEPAQDVIIEDTTPVNTTFASASGAPTIDTPGVGNTGLVRWHLGNQPSGASGTVTLVVNVRSPLTNGTPINNIVSIRDTNGGATDQDTATTTISSGHGFTLSKSDSPDPVTPSTPSFNSLINYTILWQVTGSEPAQNAIITDTIPANTTFFGCSGCFPLGGGVYRWNLGTHNPGDSGAVTLQVRVNELTPNGTVIANTARISDENGGAPVSASTSTTVQSSHSLTIDKSAPATAGVGQQILYTINFSVLGDEVAPSVVITDAIPANTIYIAGSCTGGCTVNGNVVTWNLGNRNPGSSGQVQFLVRVDNGVANGTEITNTAYISDNSGAANTDSAITRVGTSLNILLTDNRDTVQPGERITYTITYSSTEPLLPGIVQIDIPANTTLVDASNGYIPGGGNTIGWLVLQQAGVSGQLYLVVQLLPVLDNGTVISTTARIAGNGQSNQDDESAVVVSQPNLTTSTKTVSNPGARAGELVTYQITLTNTGNMHAYNTTVSDTIPAEMVYVGNLTASSGVPTFATDQVNWQGEVRVGSPVIITFEARVSNTVATGTIIENIAAINDGLDPAFQRIAIIAVGSQAPRVSAIYLPIINKGNGDSKPPTGPDVELTIFNCGDTNAVGAFWVDLYFNPNEHSPFWPIGHGEGYDWFGQGAGFVVSTLGPGQSKSLYLADAVVKNMPNPLPTSARLYAQVDLFDKTTPDIGVVDEGPGGEANNVAGSSGSTCNATPGKPDLIVTGIRLLGTSSAQHAVVLPARLEGVEPAPARIQRPKQ